MAGRRNLTSAIPISSTRPWIPEYYFRYRNWKGIQEKIRAAAQTACGRAWIDGCSVAISGNLRPLGNFPPYYAFGWNI
jgi:hypothetical protein